MRFSFIASILALGAGMTMAAPVAPNADTQVEARGPRGAHITWYSGHMLDNPYCGGTTPTDSDLVAATPWDSPYGCGDKIFFDYYGNKVTVTVVDKCDSCSGTWFDISKGAFSRLTNLEVGELWNVDFWKVN